MADNAKCPKWCVTDPGDEYHIHRTERTEVDQYKSGTLASVNARGGSFGLPGSSSGVNQVVVHSYYRTPDADSVINGDLYVPQKDAPELAGVFEALSHLTPGQIRELAAGIRQHAAEMEPEAGA